MPTTSGSLYRELAKDFTPKKAEMRICQYVEKLEARIAALESAESEEAETPAKLGRPKKREQDADTAPVVVSE